MKALIVSDSHGNQERLAEILQRESFDALFFCGDGEGLENTLLSMPGCPAVTAMVRGNNDFCSCLRSDVILPFGGNRIFMTHGHRYRLYNGFSLLAAAARENACNICLFGHTHMPYAGFEDGVLLINPGSVSLPRQEGRIPSYAVLTTGPEGSHDLGFFDARTGEELKGENG